MIYKIIKRKIIKKMNTKIDYENGIVDEVSIGNITSSVDFIPIQQVVSTTENNKSSTTAPSSSIVLMDITTDPEILREMDKQEASTPRVQFIQRNVEDDIEKYDDAKFKRFKSVITDKDGITRIIWEDEKFIAEYPKGLIKSLLINGKLNPEIKKRIIKLQ